MSLKICIPAIAAFLLAACSGDGNNAGDPDPSAEADFVVDTFGDLSVCTDKREGATAYVKDEDNDYICSDGDWAIDTNADTRKKSSSSKDEANSSNSKDKAKSSSSRCEDCKDEANSSSSAGGEKSSSSLKEFDWSIPKEDYLNPKISYGTLTDPRDGQTYKTVEIGDQVWMAENLNYYDETFDGRSWCHGAENSATTANCAVSGRLYTWTAAIDSAKLHKDNSIVCSSDKDCSLPAMVSGVCPTGWHLPRVAEWKRLFSNVGDSVGVALKSQMGWNDDGNGTDAYGFSALPAGFKDYNDYVYEGAAASFWSADEHIIFCTDAACISFAGTYAYCINLYSGSSGWSQLSESKRKAYSVRCLQDVAEPEAAWDYLNPNIDYGEMVDDRDGQIYKTVTIGSQIWMAENLNYEVDSSFCYNDSAKYCRMFGRLYRWAAAIGKSERECGYGNTCGLSGKVRGVCPEGWHLPDTTEWRTLINEVGEDSTAGYILKSQTGWLYGDNGSDVYGFSALPAGYRSRGDSFDKGIYADFWSATEVNNKISAYYMCLRKFDKEYANADLSYTTKNFGYSVRCIQD